MIEGRAGLALEIGEAATLQGGGANLAPGKKGGADLAPGIEGGADLVPETKHGGAGPVLVTGDEVGPILGTGNETGLIPGKGGGTDLVTGILDIGHLLGAGSDYHTEPTVHCFFLFLTAACNIIIIYELVDQTIHAVKVMGKN